MMDNSTTPPTNQSTKIALLATGDELVHGDILNTNGQFIAHSLSEHGFELGLQMMVNDAEAEIVAALQYLLQNHAIVIMTGGLGPTSDDRSRFALAKALNKPLLFDEASWQAIVDRLSHYKINIHLQQQIDREVAPYVICTADQTAAELLVAALEQYNTPLCIQDHATSGLLEYTLSTPTTRPWLQFKSRPEKTTNTIQIHIDGLHEVWHTPKNASHTTLNIHFSNGKVQKKHHKQLPFRNHRVVKYAVEYISHTMLKFMAEHLPHHQSHN